MRGAHSTRTSAVVLAAALSASLARASDGPPVLLSWVAPTSGDCPDAAYALGELRRYVGSAPSVAPRARIEANVNIHGAPGERWKLELKTKDNDVEGERVFQDASCRAVADAAVVVLAWMIDPDAMAQRALPAAQHTEPAKPPALKRPPLPPPKPPGHVGPRALVGLGVAGDFGSLPALAFGAEVRAGVILNPVRLQAHAEYWPSLSKTSATLSDGSPAGASFVLWALGVEACVQALPRNAGQRVGLGVCAGPQLDVVRGVGFGVNAPTHGSKRWLSLAGSLELTARVTDALHLFLSAGGVLPSEREHFALRGVGEVYRPAALSARASAGIELEL